MRFFTITFLSVCIVSCSPILGSYTSVSKPSLSSSAPVYIFTPEEKLPDNVQEIGGMKYNTQFLVSCTFYKQFDKLKLEARKLGANIIKVNNFGDSSGDCFDTLVTFYYIEEDRDLNNKDDTYKAHADYAKLFILPSTVFEKKKSNKNTVFLNDQKIRLTQSTKYLEYLKPQDVDLYLADDYTMNFTVEAGKNYYIQVYYNTHKQQYEIKKIEPIVGRLNFENDSNQFTKLEIKFPSELERNEVIELEQSFNLIAEKSNSTNLIVSKKKITDLEKEDFNSFDFYVKSGLTYRLGRIPSGTPPDLRNITEEFKTGLFVEVNASYFFDATNGIGFTFSNSSSSTTQNIFSSFNTRLNTSALSGNAKAELQVNYYGVNYTSRYRLNEKSKDLLTFHIGLGLLESSESYSFASGRLSFKSTAVALNSAVNYDFQLMDNFYLGLNLGLVLSSSNKASVSNGLRTETIELEDSLSLSRIDLGVGLRYTF